MFPKIGWLWTLKGVKARLTTNQILFIPSPVAAFFAEYHGNLLAGQAESSEEGV